jgi:hypothetical protein
MSELSRRAYEKRTELEGRARQRLKSKVLGAGFTHEDLATAERASMRLKSLGYTVVASRGYGATGEWFDLEAGLLTLEQAIARAVESRGNPRLNGWAITVYRGLREAGYTLEHVAQFSELA